MAEQNLSMLPVIKAFANDPVEARRYAGQTETVRAIDPAPGAAEGAISPAGQVLGAGTVLLLLGLAGNP